MRLICGAAAMWPFSASTQPSPKPARLGYFAPAANADLLEALRAGLRDLGYVEGRNLAIEFRYLAGQSKSYDELAAELVHLAPDVIVVVGTPPALAAKRQTKTIPIIMAPAADPLLTGLVTSLARPGGNVSGVALYGSELARKRMEILQEVAPGIRRVAVLGNAGNPLHRLLWKDLEPIAPALGLEFRLFVVADTTELQESFSAMRRNGFDALTHLSDAQFFSARRRIAELAMQHRLPSVHEAREHVEDGALVSYGPNIPDLTRRAAVFVVKVLNGTNPANLPTEQPTKFELVVNLKTAKALGLTVQPALLARANEVIE